MLDQLEQEAARLLDDYTRRAWAMTARLDRVTTTTKEDRQRCALLRRRLAEPLRESEVAKLPK